MEGPTLFGNYYIFFNVQFDIIDSQYVNHIISQIMRFFQHADVTSLLL